MREFRFRGERGGAAITVKVTARAKRNGLVGLMADGTLQLRVTAPPVDGQANLAVIALLAEVLGVRPSQLEIVAGQTNPRKLISIIGMDAKAVDEAIRAALKARRP